MSMATRMDTQSPALHVADRHDLIRVHGARENNLKDVSIEIPKRRLTVFTGVSGSGKSSLVGTATDANAMLRILFSRLGQPHIGSPSAFSFNTPSVRASGAITVERGAAKAEKVTFTRIGGMCPRCEGRGSVTDFDLSQLYDESKSLNEGALTIPGYSMDGWYGRIFLGCGFFDPDKPLSKYTKRERHDLLHKEPTKIK